MNIFSQLQECYRQDIRELPVLDDLIGLMRGRKILITGGTGFFGRWLLALFDELNMRGAGVSITIVSRAPEKFLNSNPCYRNVSWLKWITSDIAGDWYKHRLDVNYIIHAATDTTFRSSDRPLTLFDSIVNGARGVLEFAAKNGVERVLMVGSGAQYGVLLDQSPVNEEYIGACRSEELANVYGEAKRVQETLSAIYAHEHGVQTVLTRCFAFSGPGLALDAHFAIGNFVRDALVSQSIKILSSGSTLRSYLHGSDLAAWLLVLLCRGQSGGVYNVGSNRSVSIAKLARLVVERIAPEKSVRILGQRSCDGRQSYIPDIQRARGHGLDVWTSLEESIDSMARYARLTISR